MGIQLINDVVSATEYMLSALAQGTTLARLASKSIDLSRGTFRLLMATMVDPSRPLDLTSGSAVLAGDEERLFVHIIRSFIRNPGCALIMQDSEAHASDPIMQKLPYRHLAVGYGAEVYWQVAESDVASLSDDQMLDLIHCTSYFPWTGFFYCDHKRSVVNTQLTDEDITRVLSNLRGVAVGALDYDSFLIWWRDDLRPFPFESEGV
jgi:hypothetical protein